MQYSNVQIVRIEWARLSVFLESNKIIIHYEGQSGRDDVESDTSIRIFETGLINSHLIYFEDDFNGSIMAIVSLQTSTTM